MNKSTLCHILYISLILATGFLLFSVIDAQRAAVPISRDYILEHGVKQTGAINLVSSIYLGYRAIDTLGETIILFLAVSGTVLYLGRKSEKN